MGLGSRSQSDYVRGVTQVCGPGGNVDSNDCWDNRYGYGIQCDTWFKRDTSKETIHVSAMTDWVVKCPDNYAVTGVCFSGSGSDCRQFSTTDNTNNAYSQVHTILECTPVAGGLGDVIKRCPGDDERTGYDNSVAKIFFGAPAPSGSVYTWVCNGGSNIKDCSANLQDSRGGSTPTCRGDNPSDTEVDYNAMTMGFAAEINNQYTGRRLESEAYSDGGGALTDDQVVAGAKTSTACPTCPRRAAPPTSIGSPVASRRTPTPTWTGARPTRPQSSTCSHQTRATISTTPTGARRRSTWSRTAKATAAFWTTTGTGATTVCTRTRTATSEGFKPRLMQGPTTSKRGFSC